MGYSELDRVDLRVSDRATNTVSRAIQCDGRSSDELAARPARSMAFALIKIATARAYYPDALVEYTYAVEPPAYLADFIAAAGCGVRFEDLVIAATPAARPSLERLGALADRALAALAVEAAGGQPAADALARYEARVVAEVTDEMRHTDSVAYWTAVVELAALAGEVVRALAPCRWRFAAERHPPFALHIGWSDGRVINGYLLDNAQMLIKHGEAESVAGMVQVIRGMLREPRI